MSQYPEQSVGDPREIVRISVARRRERRPPFRTNAFRLLNGMADGAPPGFTADLYGRWMVVSARESLPRETVLRWCKALDKECLPEGAVIKWLSENPKESRSELLSSHPPPVLVVEEDGARIECRLADGVQTGLFLDHRETRLKAKQLAKNVEVLNVFAYTCAFSVQAALGGASRVTSVDVSQRALSTGRRNMTHSGLDPDQHRWFADDALIHLKRARRSYGLVVVDPPVFGHGRKPFSLERDLELLFEGALNQLALGGHLIFSTHHTRLDHAHLERAVMRSSARLGIDVQVTDRMGLPSWDHPVCLDASLDDRGSYLTTVVAKKTGERR